MLNALCKENRVLAESYESEPEHQVDPAIVAVQIPAPAKPRDRSSPSLSLHLRVNKSIRRHCPNMQTTGCSAGSPIQTALSLRHCSNDRSRHVAVLIAIDMLAVSLLVLFSQTVRLPDSLRSLPCHMTDLGPFPDLPHNSQTARELACGSHSSGSSSKGTRINCSGRTGS